MRWTRAVLGLVAIVAAGGLLVSGGSGADPRTPRGLPGMPPPFLGTAVVGDGGLAAAIDAYGDVVDLRAPGPGGRALIDNPAGRQAAGTVPADTGIVPWAQIRGRPSLPLWRADSIAQRYRPGTNVLVTTARFGSRRVRIVYAAGDSVLACLTGASGGARVLLRFSEPAARRVHCDDGAARQMVERAERGGRRWLRRAQPLGAGAPPWAGRMYQRSLLVLRALTDRRSGAGAAGARDGWAYVWPRDAATVALALNAAGYRGEARRVTRFLLGLDLGAAARFYADGEPVPGRGPQGDASGWVAAAADGMGFEPPPPGEWRNLPDYQEGEPGNYLGNALSAEEPKGGLNGRKSDRRREDALAAAFGVNRGLVREAYDPGSGFDSAAAWAVAPFARPSLYAAARQTMLRLVNRGTRFGITPGEGWAGGGDPWSAPTAWTAWSLATLGGRRPALRLLADLRRAATPAGMFPERVDARTGIPRSTTPLAWSHAFAILALQELWPTRTKGGASAAACCGNAAGVLPARR